MQDNSIKHSVIIPGNDLIELMGEVKNKKQTKYGEEEHESSWYLHHSSAPYVCESKEAHIFTATYLRLLKEALLLWYHQSMVNSLHCIEIIYSMKIILQGSSNLTN